MPRTPLQSLRRKRSEALDQIARAERRVARLKVRADALAAQITATGAKLDAKNAPRIPRSPRGSNKLAFDLVRAHGFVTSQSLAEALAAAMKREPCYALRQRAVHALRALEKAGALKSSGGRRDRQWRVSAAPPKSR